MTRKKDCLKGQKILKAKLKTKMKKNQNQSDKLDYIFKNFDTNFKNAGENVLKKLAKDEKSLIIIICFLKQKISLFLKMLIF